MRKSSTPVIAAQPDDFMLENIFADLDPSHVVVLATVRLAIDQPVNSIRASRMRPVAMKLLAVFHRSRIDVCRIVSFRHDKGTC